MGWKFFLSFLFVLFVIIFLGIYWFIPLGTVNLNPATGHSNFSIEDYGKDGMQFYKNMRYPNPEISYNIYDCNIEKEDEMLRALEIISNSTMLTFYSVNSNEEIFISCDETDKFDEGLFIAGEGGPTNITKTENFNVILNGKILLIRNSDCPKPNIALHELLHALGFDHSLNKNNIMYNISECYQTIGQDITEMIDKVYSVKSYSDLSFENVSGVMHGKYLDTNISIRNNGLKMSQDSIIEIYADDKLINEIDLEPLDIGYGKVIMLRNVFVKKISVDDFNFIIKTSFNELDKNNNEIKLKINKK